MKFSQLAEYLSELEKTPSRNKMTAILAEVFSKLDKNEIDKGCYLLLGELKPKFFGIEFNIAEKLMIKAIARALDKKEAQVREKYQQTGDLGETIYELKCQMSNVKCQNNLSISEVYERLYEIAWEEGQGSVERKLKKMADLFSGLDRLSVKYVARIPVKKLRLGFSDMTILDALSWMKKRDKSLRPELERAFNVRANIGEIAKIFKTKGSRGIRSIEVQMGTPIRMALAERLSGPEEIVKKLGKFAVEPKYDGVRCQLHLDKTQHLEKGEGLFKQQAFFVKIYSRNLDNTTHMFPDITRVLEQLQVKQVILDGEAIGFNPKTGDFLPFQETVQRKRKHGIKAKSESVPLKVFVYDILYLDGQPVWRQPFVKRRQQLEKVLKNVDSDRLQLTEQTIVDNVDQLKSLVKQYLDDGLEGAMCKKLDTTYQAGGRSFNWVKYKKSTQKGLADTIDAVVMGYDRGKGKRQGFGIGAFLVGIRDKNKFKTVAKIGTGLSDDQWREMKKRCDQLKTDDQPKNYEVAKITRPDFWCRPEMVVEIKADEITQSPVHTAGLALRFPRLEKFRDEKDINQATSVKEIKKLYDLQ